MTGKEKQELQLREEVREMQNETYKQQSKIEWEQSSYNDLINAIIDKQIDIAVASIESILEKNGEISTHVLRLFISDAVLYARQH